MERAVKNVLAIRLDPPPPNATSTQGCATANLALEEDSVTNAKQTSGVTQGRLVSLVTATQAE